MPVAGGPGVILDLIGPHGEPLRVLSRAIGLPGREQPFVYTVAGDRREIDAETERFNRLLVLGLGTLLLGVVAAVLIQVRFGLEPLRRIRRSLADIRIGQAKRLAGDYPEEIRPLADELNALLDHNEAVVERARTHVGNLAHGLKTPIAVLTNEASRSRGSLAAPDAAPDRADAPAGRPSSVAGARHGDRLGDRLALRGGAGAVRSAAHARADLRRPRARDRGRLPARARLSRRPPGSRGDARQPARQRLQMGAQRASSRAPRRSTSA